VRQSVRVDLALQVHHDHLPLLIFLLESVELALHPLQILGHEHHQFAVGVPEVDPLALVLEEAYLAIERFSGTLVRQFCTTLCACSRVVHAFSCTLFEFLSYERALKIRGICLLGLFRAFLPKDLRNMAKPLHWLRFPFLLLRSAPILDQ
jgi:hypothetical protein